MDRPVIQYIVEEGLASAADEVVIVNSREKKSIEEHFSPNPELVSMLRERGKDKYADAVEHAGNLNVSYVYQDEPLGLGHAVHCAAEKTGDEDAPSNLAVFGRYLLSARVMELLAEAKPTVGGEIQLTDALDAVLKEEEMYALVIDPQDGFDTGTVESWLETNNILFERKYGKKA